MSSDSRTARDGLIFGVIAYGLWGVIPLYFKLIAHISPWEQLAHRVAWSALFLGLVVTGMRRWSTVAGVARDRRLTLFLLASTLMIGGNWLAFIYAVSQNRVMEASLGYFITPLGNVALGCIVLGERLRRGQAIGIALAVIGVGVQVAARGEVPWIAISLTLTFSMYGLLRKMARIDALVGLAFETLTLTPIALGYLCWLASTHSGEFGQPRPGIFWLLAASGIVTSIPLLCFAAAARRLPLTTLGILQYIPPSMQFMLAVFVFGEKFSTPQAVSFAFIWTAVVIYTVDSVRRYRRDVAERELASREASLIEARTNEPRAAIGTR